MFVSAAFLWMLMLGVSPRLHARVHSDANRIEHACAVTFVTSGSYNYSGHALVDRTGSFMMRCASQLDSKLIQQGI
jgi:hypothetical protein